MPAGKLYFIERNAQGMFTVSADGGQIRQVPAFNTQREAIEHARELNPVVILT